jgi:DNA polymerase elongation subunit (family B)
MKYVAFDIETMPDVEQINNLPEPEVATGNIKDPEKIAARIAAAKKEQISKMALSPLTGEIASAAFFSTERQDVVFGELEILEATWQHIMNGNKLVTFNGKSFDVPFIFKRGIIHGLKWATIPNMKRYTDKYKAMQHIDVMEEWCAFGERIKLSTLSQLLLGQTKLDFDFAETPELLKTEEGRAKIAEYNTQDAYLTYRLAERMGLLV